MLETSLGENYRNHFVGNSLKLAVSYEEAQSSAVSEEFAVFSGSKLAVGYKAAVMKCVGMVKQATAKGLLHSSFVPKPLDKENTDRITATTNPEIVPDRSACDIPVFSSPVAEKANQLTVNLVNEKIELVVADSVALVTDKVACPDKNAEETMVTSELTLNPSSESCFNNTSIQDKDNESKCDFLTVQYESLQLGSVGQSSIFDDEHVANSKTVPAVTACHSSDDSNEAGTVLKPRKTVRISDFPPEVSYFRHSSNEMAHKRKHNDSDSKTVGGLFPLW